MSDYKMIEGKVVRNAELDRDRSLVLTFHDETKLYILATTCCDDLELELTFEDKESRLAELAKECQLAQNRIAELEKLCTTLSKPIADLLTAGVAFPTNVMPDIMTIKKLHGLR